MGFAAPTPSNAAASRRYPTSVPKRYSTFNETWSSPDFLLRKEKNSKRNNSHRKCKRRGRANFVFCAETSCALGYFGATHGSSKRPHSKTRGGVANAWKILAISGSNFEMSFPVQAAIRDISISLKKIRSRQIGMNQKHEQTVRRNYPLMRNKKPLKPKPWGTKQPIRKILARRHTPNPQAWAPGSCPSFKLLRSTGTTFRRTRPCSA